MLLIAASLSVAACSGGSVATPTPTASPVVLATAPTAVPTPPLALTATPLLTPTPKPFVITDPAFAATVKEDCDTAVQITGSDATGLTVQPGTLWMYNGEMVLFCYGAKHTWIGTLTRAGHKFASHAHDPLQCMVVRGKGYVYVVG